MLQQLPIRLVLGGEGQLSAGGVTSCTEQGSGAEAPFHKGRAFSGTEPFLLTILPAAKESHWLL